jgi:NitT/TauT family transport system substrate-binding protein
MKKLFKIISVLCVVSMFTLSFAGCGSTESAAESTTEISTEAATSTIATSAAAESTTAGAKFEDAVKLSFTTWIGYAPFFIAKEKGLYEKNGAKVEIHVIESAGDIKAAAMAGQVQGVAQTADTATMAAGAGLDFVQVLALDTSNGGDGVVSKKEFNSLADLKGKKVALNTTGGASLFYFNYLIDDLGMTMDDFNIQNMSSGDAGSAFVGGKVDAAVTWEPWLTNAKNTEFGKILASSTDAPGVIIDTLSFNRDFIKKYPGTVQAIVKSWFDALDFIKANPDEAYKIMADSQGLSIDEFKATLPSVTYYDKAMNKDYFESGKFKEICKKASDLWLKMKLIDKGVDADSIIDNSYISK